MFSCGVCILPLHVHSCLWVVAGEVEVGLKVTVGFNVVDLVLFCLPQRLSVCCTTVLGSRLG